MPALQITNGIQLKLYYSLNANLAMNVLGLTPTGAVTVNQALAETVGSMVKAAWTAQIGPHATNKVSLVRVGIRDLRVANLPEFKDTGNAVTGVATGTDSLPGFVAVCITLRTAKSGKSFRGRSYVPGFAELDNDLNGLSTNAAGLAAAAFINAIGSGIQSSQMKLAVLSYPSDDVKIVKTTTHQDGTTSVRTLSHEVQKVGQATEVTIVESRNATWEVQRRRVNARGGLPTALDARISLPIP